MLKSPCQSWFVLIKAAIIIAIFLSQSRSAIAATAVTESSPAIEKLSVKSLADAEIVDLLKVPSHIKDIPLVFFLGNRDATNEKYVLLSRQLLALDAVSQGQIIVPLDVLLAFVDYPANSRVASRIDESKLVIETSDRLKSWPVFKIIWRFKAEFGDQLKAFVLNDTKDLQLRLTVLQMLYLIDSDECSSLAHDMIVQCNTSGQFGAADKAKRIAAGQLKFWGLIPFRPINMTREQVLELVSSQKHFENIPSRSGPKQDYKLYLNQLEAIRNAGDLRMLQLVPVLLQYMNYPGGFRIFMAGSVSPQRNAEDWPAFGAIRAMVRDAVPILVRTMNDKNQRDKIRITAYAVLKNLNENVDAHDVSELLNYLQNANEVNAVKAVESIKIDQLPALQFRID